VRHLWDGGVPGRLSDAAQMPTVSALDDESLPALTREGGGGREGFPRRANLEG
jgi:hypothetical protein